MRAITPTIINDSTITVEDFKTDAKILCDCFAQISKAQIT